MSATLVHHHGRAVVFHDGLLAPGECYAVLADGRFERRQLEPFEPKSCASREHPERKKERRVESTRTVAKGRG